MESLQELLKIGPFFALKFGVAAVCGGIVGLERELGGKSAGLRTNLLICLGAMLFTEASYRLAGAFGGDPTRVAAQVVTGIGFLGAGVILHGEHGGVRGLTTAALIWLMAAVGMLIGAGLLLTAVLVTLATLLIAIGLNPLERAIAVRQAHEFRVVIPDHEESRRKIQAIVHEHEGEIPRFVVDPASETGSLTAYVFQYTGGRSDRTRLLGQLERIDGARIERTSPGVGRRDE